MVNKMVRIWVEKNRKASRTKLRETETVELKAVAQDGIKKEIVAFANSNGGTVYVGVGDDCTVLQLARLALATSPCGVVAVGGGPPPDDVWLAREHLVADVAVLIGLFKRHRSGADNRHPFCQDEKTRLPAELLRLDR